jgi:hypothetical protein
MTEEDEVTDARVVSGEQKAPAGWGVVPKGGGCATLALIIALAILAVLL